MNATAAEAPARAERTTRALLLMNAVLNGRSTRAVADTHGANSAGIVELLSRAAGIIRERKTWLVEVDVGVEHVVMVRAGGAPKPARVITDDELVLFAGVGGEFPRGASMCAAETCAVCGPIGWLTPLGNASIPKETWLEERLLMMALRENRELDPFVREALPMLRGPLFLDDDRQESFKRGPVAPRRGWGEFDRKYDVPPIPTAPTAHIREITATLPVVADDRPSTELSDKVDEFLAAEHARGMFAPSTPAPLVTYSGDEFETMAEMERLLVSLKSHAARERIVAWAKARVAELKKPGKKS